LEGLNVRNDPLATKNCKKSEVLLPIDNNETTDSGVLLIACAVNALQMESEELISVAAFKTLSERAGY